MFYRSTKYNNINIDFHDDMSNITHGLWVNYYKNFYRDSTQEPAAYDDNKFKERNYEYGIYNNKSSNNNFIDTIVVNVTGKFNLKTNSIHFILLIIYVGICILTKYIYINKF